MALAVVQRAGDDGDVASARSGSRPSPCPAARSPRGSQPIPRPRSLPRASLAALRAGKPAQSATSSACVQQRGEVAAVVDRAGQRLVWAAAPGDEVAPAQLGAVDAESAAQPFSSAAPRAACPTGRIKLIQGDSDLFIAGGGTGGSKSMIASRHRHRRAFGEGRRPRQEDRLARARGLLGDSSSRTGARHCRHRPRYRPPGAGAKLHGRPDRCRTTCRRPWMSRTSWRPVLGLPERRRIAESRSTRHRRRRCRNTRWSATSARSSTRCWSKARRMAASSRASARR